MATSPASREPVSTPWFTASLIVWFAMAAHQVMASYVWAVKIPSEQSVLLSQYWPHLSTPSSSSAR